MIYSSVEDNWMRVEIMHSIAQSYFNDTHDTDFRQRMTSRGNPFPFDAIKFDTMQKESCIVGMVMAWSVVTLESLVNHALAEALNNKISAKAAIEYPGQILNKLRIGKSAKSELAKKLIILGDGVDENKELIDLANKLSETRNLIVHDKPFQLTDYGDGDVEIEHYRLRGKPEERRSSYEDLQIFYEECDKVKSYILTKINLQLISGAEISFGALING